MNLRTMTNVLAGAALAAGLGVGAAHAAPVDSTGEGAAQTEQTMALASRPMLRVPFNCGRTWRTHTGGYHDNDGWYSVDMNWGAGDDDFGLRVMASASGTARVYNNSWYGRHVVVHHGGGWSTLYAHLSSVNVTGGQAVGPRTVLGRLGESGNATAPHLHYAQKLNGNAVRIKFGTSTWITYPDDTVRRIRDCL